MTLRISAVVERWPVNGHFTIARGAKKFVDLLVVVVSDGTRIGYGEGTAIYYSGETAEKCLGQVERVIDELEAHSVSMAREILQSLLPSGAARNALDCALWDLEAKQTGRALWELVGMRLPPLPLETAFTISLGTPDAMLADARSAAKNGYSLLKLKLNGDADRDRVAAVRAGARDARIIVDANESWGAVDIAAEAEALKHLGVAMIEQPLPAGQDAALANISSPLPIFADESCHAAQDVPRLVGLYQGVNIKLDKAGGLTEALALRQAAQSAKMQVMVGCMLSTSLAIQPAFLVAQSADWVDLDGPVLLANDRPGGFSFANGCLSPA
ncbi:N-acetyl-D-Glu racemase DgcA [Sphingorhabdus sp.]|uniref:N-acetyl-D-Glu racemase DgcA n=1 Tax=Sphingorhabdus sp. TaxID=1902408 RepID=UPI00391D53C4